MLTTALKRYYREPDIAISVTSLHVESISVLGAVGTPGVIDLKGPTTLLEALSSAGGVRGDAGRVAIVTRQGAWVRFRIPMRTRSRPARRWWRSI